MMRILEQKITDDDRIQITGIVETGRSDVAVFSRTETWEFSLNDSDSISALARCLEGVTPASRFEVRD